MEYAVSISIVAVFIVVYLLTRPKVRPLYYDEYDDSCFNELAKNYVKNFVITQLSKTVVIHKMNLLTDESGLWHSLETVGL